MKILHVTYADSGGGAALAAHRLHLALRNSGVDSSMLVRTHGTGDPHVHVARQWFPGRNGIARRLQQFALDASPAPDPLTARSLNLVPSGLHRRINASDADIVHLHWINEEMISVAEVGRISKPVVWTMHDCWAMAGSEHYPSGMDTRVERTMRARKRRHWRTVPAALIAPSSWMAARCNASEIFKNRDVHVIPNAVPADAFGLRDRCETRRRLGIDAAARVLLFGADEVTSPRKGADLLPPALRHLDNVMLIAFGRGELPAMPVPVRRTGWSDDLVSLYNAADVLLAPSRIDNLPNIVAEAAACGLPAVAFGVGGMPDLIGQCVTGYLASPFDTADFAAGIRWVLEQREPLRAAVVDRARRYSPAAVASAHVDVYQAMIGRS